MKILKQLIWEALVMEIFHGAMQTLDYKEARAVYLGKATKSVFPISQRRRTQPVEIIEPALLNFNK